MKRARVRSAEGPDLSHQRCDVPVELRVLEVVVDVQGIDAAAAPADVTVPEVPAQKLRVGPRVETRVVTTRARGAEVRLPSWPTGPLVEPPHLRMVGTVTP